MTRLAPVADRRAALEARHPVWRPATIAGALDAAAERHPDRPFVLTDDRTFTYDEVRRWSERLATGLVALGVAPGDVVVLIGDNRPAWIWGEIAAHACRARSLGIYRDALDDEVAYLLTHSGASVVIAEDEEQVDKLLHISDRVPSLEHIFYADPRGMRKYRDPRLRPLSGLVAMCEKAAPEDWDALVEVTSGEQVAILCTTSGTTANPKLAMLAASRVLRHCATYL